jgi:hypothetical protein
MRSKLLLSTAVLLAGFGLASAQNTPSGGGAKESGAAPAQEHQSAPKQGQTQQKEPMQRGQKNQTTGQAPQKDQGPQSIDGRDKAQPQRSQRDRDQTTGQGQRDQSQSPSRTQREQSPTQAQPPQREQGQQGQSGQSQPGQAQQGQAQQGKAAGSTTLTTEQRTKIRQTVLTGGNVPRATNVNFSINVGTVVPTTVRVVAVPAVIVEIHPEWRGYMYFVVGDEIIIVDRSHRIVAVLAV